MARASAGSGTARTVRTATAAEPTPAGHGTAVVSRGRRGPPRALRPLPDGLRLRGGAGAAAGRPGRAQARMSRRARALAFLLAALVCAIARGAARRPLPRHGRRAVRRPAPGAGRRRRASRRPAHRPGAGGDSLAVRRVPARFVPPGALRRPQRRSAGRRRRRSPRAPTCSAPSCGARGRAPAGPGCGPGGRPVQIAVSGAEALLVGWRLAEGSRVDVVVSQRAGLGRRGRTYVAAAGVRLLALARPAGPGEGWSATLALTRDAGARADRGRELRPRDPAAAASP